MLENLESLIDIRRKLLNTKHHTFKISRRSYRLFRRITGKDGKTYFLPTASTLGKLKNHASVVFLSFGQASKKKKKSFIDNSLVKDIVTG